MPTTFRATPRAALAAFLLVILASGRILAADPATDEYEQARVERFADRIVRVVNTDHARWLKVLEDAYPGRVTEPADRAGYAAWFELLGGDGEWRRAGSPTGAVAALFDRVVESRRLGPVPSISRAEFLRYADRELDRGRRRAAESVPEYDAEADRVFRALDRDADGILAPEEMTTAVRRGGLAADPDANGRVDRDEYRAFFRRLVEANNEAAVARAVRVGRGEPLGEWGHFGVRVSGPDIGLIPALVPVAAAASGPRDGGLVVRLDEAAEERPVLVAVHAAVGVGVRGQAAAAHG
ncbi:MAG TPA: hypothetical protein VM529_20645, partial [Gemmata sp.]|nr:hypothetical protein [Gemmata sp.]